MLSGVSFRHSGSSRRIAVAVVVGLAALGLGIGAASLIARLSPASAPVVAQATTQHRALPLLPTMAPDAPEQPSRALDETIHIASAPSAQDNPTQAASPSEPAESSAARPFVSASPSKPAISPLLREAPLPPSRPFVFASPGPAISPSGPFDHMTAVYDLTAHTVYMPDGTRLEAHSGLGDRLDDPRHVDEPDHGATPPHVYDLTMREGLFHGVQALRLNPVGGESTIFGRVGLLAHPYMLGPTGDSNGCVSFKDYDAFLEAFQSGKVKRLAVVAGLNRQILAARTQFSE